MKLKQLVETASSAEIATAIIKTYQDIERYYSLEEWKTSELDSGHFVEAVRRFLEFKLFAGKHTPFKTKLSNFNDAELKRFENATGDESYRILIPRALYSIYGVRNKRGVGHLTGFSANQMDATLILYTCKWVLAELVRLNSQLDLVESSKLIEQIIERKIDILWVDASAGIRQVIGTKISAPEKVLVLLFHKSPCAEAALLTDIKYSNASRFTKYLKTLDKQSLIHYDKDKKCHLSPLGRSRAEKIILEKGIIS